MINFDYLITNSCQIYDQYLSAINFSSNKSTILIGSSPSISCYELEQYIDNYDGYVIRINRPAQKEYIKNYGTRTDLYFTHQKCILLNNLDSSENIVRITTQDKLKLYELFDDVFNVKLRWTTGFQGIIFSLCYFKNIELFGFGTITESFQHKYENLFISTDKSDHDIQAEHIILQQLLTNYKQIHRIEDDKSKIA